MKTLKALSVHGATVIAVMCTVFLCINFVNEAMSFYDHLFTKLLLCLLSLLFSMNLCFRRERGFFPLPLFLFAQMFALAELLFCLISLFDPFFPPFLSLFGQVLALCLCLLSLSVSLPLTVAIEKERNN